MTFELIYQSKTNNSILGFDRTALLNLAEAKSEPLKHDKYRQTKHTNTYNITTSIYRLVEWSVAQQRNGGRGLNCYLKLINLPRNASKTNYFPRESLT